MPFRASLHSRPAFPAGSSFVRQAASRKVAPIGWISLLLVLAIIFPESAQALDQVRYADQEGGNFTIIPQVGLANETFKAEGIELNRVVTQRSNDSIEAALADKVDVGSSGAPPILAAVSRGAPIEVIAVLGTGFSGSLVASKAIPNLTKIEDFKGKRIGTLLGSGVILVYQMTIAQLGLNEADYHFSNVRLADMPAAMQSGSFDAVIGWGSGLKRIVEAGYGYLAISPKEIERIAHVTYPTLIFARKDFVKAHPDLVQHFLTAWVRAQAFAQSHHDESLKIIRTALGDRIAAMSDDELREVVYDQDYDHAALSKADYQDITKTRDFMFSQKFIEMKPDLAVLIDNQFAQNAQAAAGK